MLDRLANMRILVKVLVAPLLLIVSMMILAVIFQSGIQREGAAVTKLHDESFRKAAAVADVRASGSAVQANLYRLLGWQSSGIEAAKVSVLEKQVRAQLTALHDKAAATGEASLVEKADNLSKAAIDVLDMYSIDEVTALVMMVNNEQQYDSLVTTVQAAAKSAEDDTEQVYRGAEDAAASSKTTYYGVFVVFLGLGCVTSLGMARLIAHPVTHMTEVMGRLADGQLELDVPLQQQQDEIGGMARAVQVFKANAIARRTLEEHEHDAMAQRERHAVAIETLTRDFDMAASSALAGVADAASDMKVTAQGMAATAEQTSRQATEVAAATECASSNVQTVAAAAEELSASIGEIGHQVERSSQTSRAAADEARHTNAMVKGLAEAAARIGDVVNLINDIAGQTNLLALNATIEAARAGEAGKGFAVVAGEVKNLANQTARATGEIGQQVANVQDATGKAVGAIEGIVARIGEINEIAAAIASAVEEQNAATNEISRNIQQASGGTQQVAATIGGVTQAAGETGSAAALVLGSAMTLSERSDDIRRLVQDFLQKVRAA